MAPDRLPPARQIAYGDHPDQVGNLHVPVGAGPWPTVVLIHGGDWKWGWDRTLMTPLAHDLARRGYAVWNIEYRRVGQEGGGWPGTLEDVAAAADALISMEAVDPARVVAVGHSAGGHLAVWLAARHRLPDGAPGAAPRLRLLGAVSQAGVVDLVRGAEDDLGSGACVAFLGGGAGEVPDRYAVASPASLLPLGLPVLLIHGSRDVDVPPSQSRAASAFVEFDGADHFDVIEPEHEAWTVAVAWLDRLIS
jgi:acetyl esterase/lipase